MAGLLQALAVAGQRVLPATSGCRHPHPVLAQPDVRAALRVLRRPEPVGHDRPLRVVINGFGFGSVNCHVVVEVVDAPRRQASRPVPGFIEGRLLGELVGLQAGSRQALAAAVTALGQRCALLSRDELVAQTITSRYFCPQGSPQRRVFALCYFGALILLWKIAGHAFLGFEQAWAAPIIGVLVCVAMTLLGECCT